MIIEKSAVEWKDVISEDLDLLGPASKGVTAGDVDSEASAIVDNNDGKACQILTLLDGLKQLGR